MPVSSNKPYNISIYICMLSLLSYKFPQIWVKLCLSLTFLSQIPLLRHGNLVKYLLCSPLIFLSLYSIGFLLSSSSILSISIFSHRAHFTPFLSYAPLIHWLLQLFLMPSVIQSRILLFHNFFIHSFIRGLFHSPFHSLFSSLNSQVYSQLIYKFPTLTYCTFSNR